MGLPAIETHCGVCFEVRRRQDHNRGEDGETHASFSLWLFLTKQWGLVNDVVLEPEPDEFIQVDHVLIGPPGVFLVETKAWQGAFMASQDQWRRKQGAAWVRCESPTKQNQRHLRLFQRWLQETLSGVVPPSPETWLFPVVLFTRAKWLKAEKCCMPIYRSALALSWHMRRRAKHRVLGPDHVDAIAAALVNAEPLAQDLSPSTPSPVPPESPAELPKEELPAPPIQIQEGKTRNGRTYVKILGPKQEAEKVRARYETEGKCPGVLKSDRFTNGAWIFYLENA